MAIREEVKSCIYKENVIVENDEEQGSKLKFKSFKPKKEIFEKVLVDLLEKREPSGVFFDNDKHRKGGYLSDIYGCTAILSLASDGSVILNDEQKKILIDQLNYILDEIDNYGFTLYPYINKYDNTFTFEDEFGKKEEKLFSHNYPYIGALTWAASFLTAIKKATKKNNPEIDTAEHRYLDIDQQTINRINRLIVRIVDDFNTSVIKTNDPDNPDKTLYLGWSYTKDCKEPSLFFTYSVLEAFSDFEDNVLELVSDENGHVIKDGNIVRNFKESENDLAELFSTRGGKNGVQLWADACASCAKHIWKVYGKALRKDFVDDKFLTGFGIITLDDIMKMDHTNALFNNVFLVSSLLYGWVNVLIPEEEKEIVSTMEIALQNVQRAIDTLNRRNMDYIVETYTIPFINLHNRYGDIYVRKLNYRRLDDTTILPMLIKANNMIAVYITKYPVKKMDELFEEIFDDSNISEKEMLWDDKGYDVKITERYIEAINQFYDYYVAYEEDYTIGFANAREQGRLKGRREGEKIQRNKDKEELARKEVEKETAIASVREEYTIENAISTKIRLVVEEAIVSALTSVKERVMNHNWNSNKQKEIVSYEDKLESLTLAIVEGYLAGKIKSILELEDRQMNKEEIQKELINDLGEIIEKLLNEKM